MSLAIYFLDAFTSESFRGSPTPVCITNQDLSPETMLKITQEFNQPIAAFIQETLGLTDFEIRYFSTTGECRACGHATLAAAEVMMGIRASQKVSFTTIEHIKIETHKQGDIIFMSYPRFQSTEYLVSKPMLKSLGCPKVINALYSPELESLFLELADPIELMRLEVDFALMMQSAPKLKEVVIHSLSDDGKYDFIVRSFCPWIGIDEDPVTGSIHSILAGYWSERLGNNKLKAYQASERGGEVTLQVNAHSIQIGGETVLIAKGKMEI